ncbi:hypothetical protein CAPTEDRAFT_125845, partial [Capitella teleta]
ERIEPVAIDFHERENRKLHHTDEFERKGVIARRGQVIKVTVTLDKPVRAQTDRLKLQFATGDKPQESKGTLLRINIGEKLEHDKWTAMQEVDSDGTRLTFFIQPAADAIVGEYSMFIETWFKTDEGKMKHHRHKCQEKVIILFNPWCPEDAVYMPDTRERNEYLMNDTGRIFVGQKKQIHARPWYFGQFDSVVLDAALYLLKRSYLGEQAHCNPTLVSRALSAMANSNDGDGGVLEGNWSGNYTGGRSPTQWNGSVAMLEQYMTSKRTVKFAQCWVFSGLITTLCRAIGIPSRSVTNFDSAHDTDFSMTIDQHVDMDGRPIKNMDDSVWNFHVWNEVWFRRPDLPSGNDGWQAIDATPQEASDKMMRCGPASLVAIKSGNVFLGYDAKFIFAEVNGDRVTWMVDEFDDMVPLGMSPSSVGCRISTKAIGSNDREDITHLYKHPEGSEAERDAVKRASTHSSRQNRLSSMYQLNEQHDVDFEFDGDMQPNGDITFKLRASSKTDEARTVDVSMYATAMYYTGVCGQELSNTTMCIELCPGEDRQKEWTREAKTYFNLLDEDATIGVYVMAKVQETGQVFTDRESFWVDKPDLDVSVQSDTLKVNRETKVKVRFLNPIDVTLTSIELTLDGPGLQRDIKVPIHRSIQPLQELVEEIPFTPKFPGKREIMVSLRSKQLSGLHGSVAVEIRE